MGPELPPQSNGLDCCIAHAAAAETYRRSPVWCSGMKQARAFKACPIDLVASQIDMAIVDPVVSMPQVPSPSRLTASPQRPGCSLRPTSRRWTRRDCPGSTSRFWHGLWLPRGPDATEARPCNFAVGAPNQLAPPKSHQQRSPSLKSTDGQSVFLAGRPLSRASDVISYRRCAKQCHQCFQVLGSMHVKALSAGHRCICHAETSRGLKSSWGNL